jgi:pilus assembly protein FimV
LSLDFGGAEEAAAEDDGLSLDFGGAEEATVTDLSASLARVVMEHGGDEIEANAALEGVLRQEEVGSSLNYADFAAFTEEGAGDVEIEAASIAAASSDAVPTGIFEALHTPGGDDDLFAEKTVLLPSSHEEEQSDADVVDTRMNLARAYADMGNKDQALSILEEVMAAGNEVQRQEAEALLHKLV